MTAKRMLQVGILGTLVALSLAPTGNALVCPLDDLLGCLGI